MSEGFRAASCDWEKQVAWQNREGCARCLLELRSRVEALEQQQQPAPVAEGSLLKAVAKALTVEACGEHTRRNALKYWSEEARAAILAVADWLERTGPGDDQIVGGGYAEFIAKYLRREVGNG